MISSQREIRPEKTSCCPGQIATCAVRQVAEMPGCTRTGHSTQHRRVTAFLVLVIRPFLFYEADLKTAVARELANIFILYLLSLR